MRKHKGTALIMVLLVIAIYYAYWKDLAIGGIIASGVGFAICFAEDLSRGSILIVE